MQGDAGGIVLPHLRDHLSISPLGSIAQNLRTCLGSDATAAVAFRGLDAKADTAFFLLKQGNRARDLAV